MEISNITSTENLTAPTQSELTSLEHEALSRKYGLNTNLILRLSTGQWAVFNRKFELLAIVSQFAEIEGLIKEGPDREPELRVYKKPAKSGKLQSISLEDLGL